MTTRPVQVTLNHCIARGDNQLDCNYLESDRAPHSAWATLDDNKQIIHVLSSRGTLIPAPEYNKQRLAFAKQCGRANNPIDSARCNSMGGIFASMPANFTFFRPGEIARAQERQSTLAHNASSVLKDIVANIDQFTVRFNTSGSGNHIVTIYPKHDRDLDSPALSVSSDGTVRFSHIVREPYQESPAGLPTNRTHLYGGDVQLSSRQFAAFQTELEAARPVLEQAVEKKP